VTIAEAAAFLGEGVLPTGPVVEEHRRVLMSRPWHVRSSRDECLRWDLKSFEGHESQATPAGVTRFGEHHVHLARSAKVYPGVVIDSEGGPVVVDESAMVRPGAMLIGPVYVGPHSSVLERATLRPGTAVGPWCKVNGEIGGTIFQGYANKAHDGYLGDSWVGEWANLGAGTTNSNLLNTYGEVISRAEPEGRNERTGEQFLGATIGDHVKTAICTRIMTGAVLSTGGMFASSAPVSGCTVRFAWVTDAGSRTYRPDKFLEVMVAAMARRKVTPSDAYVNAVMELQGPAAP
jgi:UDP-N-acetylglucosamine diphosphorylase/glucosamine-1-phosphate N-acetyltransferase